MRIRLSRGNVASRQRGILLMDCLVYISLITLILGVGTLAFFKCWDANKALRRNADDIVRALHAGEQWRADVRSAVGPLQCVQDGDTERLRIPAANGEIIYSFSREEVRRHAEGHSDTLLLSKVVHSRMSSDPREHVTAWRWDLELSRSPHATVLKPLFTFEAVPVQPTAP